MKTYVVELHVDLDDDDERDGDDVRDLIWKALTQSNQPVAGRDVLLSIPNVTAA